MIPEGLKEILEKTKGRTWITGRSPRMGEGVCIRLTNEDLDYLIQLVNKDCSMGEVQANRAVAVTVAMCGAFYAIVWCLWQLLT